jgi:hypothetical protein
MESSTEQPSANTEEFWALFDRYRHAPTAQLTAVGNALIERIDKYAQAEVTRSVQVHSAQKKVK